VLEITQPEKERQLHIASHQQPLQMCG
jgi:hypothetical protein